MADENMDKRRFSSCSTRVCCWLCASLEIVIMWDIARYRNLRYCVLMQAGPNPRKNLRNERCVRSRANAGHMVESFHRNGLQTSTRHVATDVTRRGGAQAARRPLSCRRRRRRRGPSRRTAQRLGKMATGPARLRVNSRA